MLDDGLRHASIVRARSDADVTEARRIGRAIVPKDPHGSGIAGAYSGTRSVPEPTLYLFDGYNLMRAGGIEERGDLVDSLAGFVALRGARGVVVFDGVGEERQVGALDVRFAAHADDLIERLAAERRGAERVGVVSTDAAIRTTAGPWVERIPSRAFLRELWAERPKQAKAGPSSRSKVEDRLDPDVRDRLERWRRERR
jgi:predicted RNA-binding protein with PIN domain